MTAPAGGTRNLAARMGRWSAQHRKKAIWGWLGLVILAFAIGGAVGTETQTAAQSGVGESGDAARTLDDSFPKPQVEQVLIQNDSVTATDRSFRAVVDSAQHRLSAVPYTQAFESPYASGNVGQISADGHSALLRFEIAGDETQTGDRVGATLDATSAAQAANPDFVVEQVGDASVNKQLNDSISDDFKQAFATSLPITLVILLVAFGALVAASVPIILALTAVLATMGIVGVLSHISPVDQSINEVILLIGLAVGVDYSMFYLRRAREERESGRSEDASLAAAAATSGRAVLVSGLTVMLAMAGMYLGGAPTFTSFATGTIIVVAVAVVGSLTVLPALLAWLGDRVEKGGVPIVKNQPWNAGENTVWSRILTPVLRHPAISAVAAAGLLLFLAIPTLHIHTATPGTDTLPQDLSVIKTYNKVQEAFSGGPIPALVAVSAGDARRPGGGGRRWRDIARVQWRRRRPTKAGGSESVVRPAGHDARQSRSHGRGDRHPAGRRRQRLEIEGRADRAPRHSDSQHDRPGPGRDCRCGWVHRRVRGLQRHAQIARAPGVRVRPVGGVPPAVGDLPLDRDPDQGDPAQP